jgi:preprotein translocase subunit SecY
MNRLIETFKNIWGIEELRKRILYTLGLLFVFRLGTFVLLPGVNAVVLNALASNRGGSNDLLGLINTFTGGAFSKGAIFALGVMPYITASIIIQLLGFAVPYFQRLQQHEGESGRKKLNQLTRFLTIGVAMVQGDLSFFSKCDCSWFKPGCLLVLWFGDFDGRYGLRNVAR